MLLVIGRSMQEAGRKLVAVVVSRKARGSSMEGMMSRVVGVVVGSARGQSSERRVRRSRMPVNRGRRCRLLDIGRILL
jgi:hypothetical protein